MNQRINQKRLKILIDIDNLTFSYYDKSLKSIKNINLNIKDGEFILITGVSGSGKSTLIKTFNGLIPHFYGGEFMGSITVQNMNPVEKSTRLMAEKVGVVFQNTDNQLFMSDVESELAFGMENLNFSKSEIANQMEKVLNSFGIEHLRNRSISELSGGEKQKLAIASVVAMKPEILILDEPTSELDQNAANDILTLIKKLNVEEGITIILIEHRIERIINFASRLIILEKGMVIHDGIPQKILQKDLLGLGIYTPPLVELYKFLKSKSIINGDIPLSIEQGIDLFSSYFNELPIKRVNVGSIQFKQSLPTSNSYNQKFTNKKPIVLLDEVYFDYSKNIQVLKNVTFKAYPGEFIAIVGKNGSGKTTLLKHLNGLLKPKMGKVIINGNNTKKIPISKLSYIVQLMFQNPSIQFFRDTLYEEFFYVLKNYIDDEDEISERIDEMFKVFDLIPYKETYPRYLSIGEQQKAALASVLISRPKILVLDEPTHGMDYKQKIKFFELIDEYRKEGNLVIVASHDIETIAKYTDRILYLSDGKIVLDDLKWNVLPHIEGLQPIINKLLIPFKNFPKNILTITELIEILNYEEK